MVYADWREVVRAKYGGGGEMSWQEVIVYCVASVCFAACVNFAYRYDKNDKKREPVTLPPIQPPKKVFKCSFCGKPQNQVKKLVAGPGVNICSECIELSVAIIEELPIEDEIRAYTC